MNAGGASGFDISPLLGGWPSSGGAGREGEAGFCIFDYPAPLSVALPIGNLASDVGNNRAVSGEVSGMVGELRERLEVVWMTLAPRPPLAVTPAPREDRAVHPTAAGPSCEFARTTQRLSQVVDPFDSCCESMGR